MQFNTIHQIHLTSYLRIFTFSNTSYRRNAAEIPRIVKRHQINLFPGRLYILYRHKSLLGKSEFKLLVPTLIYKVFCKNIFFKTIEISFHMSQPNIFNSSILKSIFGWLILGYPHKCVRFPILPSFAKLKFRKTLL